MAGFKKISCRLCFKTIMEKGFQIIDDVIRNILDGLLLKLKLHGDTNDVICNTCKGKLDAALEFKSICLNTDYTIIPYVDCENILEFNLAEVYMKEKGNENLIDISYNHKICRLCMHLINGEIKSIGDEELEAIEKLVPEMNVKIIKDPVLCKPCLDTLNTHNTFIKNCLEVERTFTDNFESSAKDSETPQASPSDLFIKHEDTDKESTIVEEQLFIKHEYIDIKSVEDERESERLLLDLSNETFNSSDCEVAEKEGLKHILNCKSRSINECGMKIRENSITLPQSMSDSSLYKCDKCIYETSSKNRVATYCVKHKKDSEAYKCDSCEYVTTKKELLRRHIVRHKDPSEIQMYTCDKCNFKTKYQRSFARHVGKHKDPSQVRMFTCNECEFVSRYKYNFSAHMLTHKSLSEVHVYKCDDCNYKTKFKRSLKCHRLRHRPFATANVQM